MRQKKSIKEMKLPKHLEHINRHAAGIDIGSKSHFVAVPEGIDETPVREFSTFTGDLEKLAEWLISCGITTVAMESTGVYWIPVFEILEYRGLEVKLVNARQSKMSPGERVMCSTASGCSSCIPTDFFKEHSVLSTRSAPFAPMYGREAPWYEVQHRTYNACRKR